jgi:hypothetical protein
VAVEQIEHLEAEAGQSRSLARGSSFEWWRPLKGSKECERWRSGSVCYRKSLASHP